MTHSLCWYLGGRFCFGSGYFNLTENYLHEILHGSKSDFDIIMAHPKVSNAVPPALNIFFIFIFLYYFCAKIVLKLKKM
jgi:hypothetical protein